MTTLDRRRFLLTTALGSPLLALSGATSPTQYTDRHTTATPPDIGRRKLGELEVSSIGMGVQNVARKYETTTPYRPAMVRLVREAVDLGVTFFDTAEAYGPHEAERIVGEALGPVRDQVVITSKFGFDIDFDTGERNRSGSNNGRNSKPAHVRRAVEGMLQRLGTDRIDLLYQHRVDPEVPIEDVAEVVSTLMDEGKVLHWGLSEMGLGTLRRAHAALPVTAVQSEYSMLWRGPEEQVLDTCEELGIGFVPWSPLGVQFLTGWIDEQTRFAAGDFRGLESRFAPENLPHNLQLVTVIRDWAERKEVSPAQVALAWLMHQRPWIVPIPGTTQLAHLQENIGAAYLRFTPAELAELDAAVRSINIEGERLPDFVQVMSEVEAAPLSTSKN
ncbi:aldo/keto reductase [Neolewinella sp.]|uniref:aldo/keto reductase n=1 Tax=Neolewinella sp. TaxID=2993543 RepID=UPI003B51D724